MERLYARREKKYTPSGNHVNPERTTKARQWVTGLLIVTLVASLTSQTTAKEHAHMDKQKDKTGILLVTFGTSNAQARKAFDNIDRMAEKRFQDTEIRWAYTSHMIRKMLAKEGKNINSPVTALAKMHDDGFTHVAVQSLHVIAGEERSEERRVGKEWRSRWSPYH